MLLAIRARIELNILFKMCTPTSKIQEARSVSGTFSQLPLEFPDTLGMTVTFQSLVTLPHTIL